MSIREKILRLALYGRRPPGYMRLADFLAEFDNGTIQNTPTTAALAEAFRRVLADEKPDPLRTLELIWGPGQRPSTTAGERHEREAPIYIFIAKHLDSDSQRWGARARAIDAAAAKFHKSPRQIENIWANYEPIYTATKELMRQQRVIDQFITTEEFDRWKDRSGEALYRLARLRRFTKSK